MEIVCGRNRWLSNTNIPSNIKEIWLTFNLSYSDTRVIRRDYYFGAEESSIRERLIADGYYFSSGKDYANWAFGYIPSTRNLYLVKAWFELFIAGTSKNIHFSYNVWIR